MGANSKIEWCHHTFNPWIGCTKVSPGCANCYAEKSTRARVLRSEGHETWGKGAVRSLTSEANWKQPLKWNREAGNMRVFQDIVLRAWATSKCVGDFESFRIVAEGPDHQDIKFTEAEWEALPRFRPRVFCASLADWLDDEVPIEWLARLMELVMLTPNLDWLLLTKRPQNWNQRITAALAEVERIEGDWPDRDPETRTGMMLNDWLAGNAPSNLWIGTTVEDQTRADERIPLLLNIPATVRFLSCEPLLSKVDLRLDEERLTGGPDDESMRTRLGPHGIHWVICGGESGPNARPMHPDWARSLRDQCAAAGVPFFFKQWGNYAPCPIGDGPDLVTDAVFKKGPGHDGQVWNIGKKKAGRLLDGIEHNGFPIVKGASA